MLPPTAWKQLADAQVDGWRRRWDPETSPRREILTSGDVGPIRLPPKSANLNAYAERFVRSIKEECLHRVVPLGEGHLGSSFTSTSSIISVRETTRDSTTSSCNDRHLRYARTPTCSGVSGSANCSVSTIERPHEGSAH